MAIAAVVAFVVWFAFIRDSGSSENSGPNSQGTTLADLQNLPSEVGHSVYWAGPQPGTTYELTRTERGEIISVICPREFRSATSGPIT